MGVVCLDVKSFCECLAWQVIEAEVDRLRAGPHLLGFLPCVGFFDCYCVSRGGSRSGGVFGPLGTAVPWNDSSEGQGGPWAPPPCCDKSSETMFFLCQVSFVRVLWNIVGFYVWGS